MSRLDPPKKMSDVLSSFYVSPQFRVKDREGNQFLVHNGPGADKAVLYHRAYSYV